MKARALELLKTHREYVALLITALVILYWMYPEILLSSIFYNDGVSHISIVRAMDDAWRNGGNVTDFWMDNINFGHALLRSYQFLLHLIVWVMHQTILSWMPVEKCFNTCIVIMAMALPAAVYKGARLLGLGRLESVIAGIAMVLVHEREGYGIGLTNYTYSGYGLYNQLLATSFFMLTIGYARTMLRTGRRTLITSVVYSITAMAHIMTGYMAAIWILIDAALIGVFERNGEPLLLWAKKLAVTFAEFGALVLLWTGHWVIPMARDGLYQRHTTFDMPAKFTGHGAEKVLTDLWGGTVLDADRLPILTVLGGLGLLFCIAAWFRKPAAGKHAAAAAPLLPLQRQLGLQTILWIMLSFGPATWGSLTKLLPFSSQMHWHRFVAAVEITMVLCGAIFLGAVWRWLKTSERRINLIAGISLFVALLAPCLIERQSFFYTTNIYWLTDTYEAWNRDSYGYQNAMDFLTAHPQSRVYMGDPVKERAWADALKVSKTIPWYALGVQFNLSVVGSIHNHQNHTETLAYNIDTANHDALELGNIGFIGAPPRLQPPASWKRVLNTANGVLYATGVRPSYFGLGYLGPAGCADNDILQHSIEYFVRSPLLARHIYPRVQLAKSCEDRKTLDEAMVQAEKLPYATELPGEILATDNVPAAGGEAYTADVRMDHPGLLLFKMNFHPGWAATVDGKRAPTTMVVPSFLGVGLDKGDHHVQLEYEVSELKRWLELLTLMGGLGTLAYMIAQAIRKRRSAAT